MFRFPSFDAISSFSFFSSSSSFESCSSSFGKFSWNVLRRFRNMIDELTLNHPMLNSVGHSAFSFARASLLISSRRSRKRFFQNTNFSGSSLLRERYLSKQNSHSSLTPVCIQSQICCLPLVPLQGGGWSQSWLSPWGSPGLTTPVILKYSNTQIPGSSSPGSKAPALDRELYPLLAARRTQPTQERINVGQCFCVGRF